MKFSKFSKDVTRYVVNRKKANTGLSCRQLAASTQNKFKINISKSFVSNLIKNAQLSSPKGRRVSEIYAPCTESAYAGYVFLLGADFLFELSEIIASAIVSGNPQLRLKPAAVKNLVRAWIISKATYNVTIDKIICYEKNDLWPLLGKKLAKGAMRQFIAKALPSQHINSHIVTLLSPTLQDVLGVRITLADGASFCLDAGQRCLWGDAKIPIDFSSTINITTSCVNSMMDASSPLVVCCSKPEAALAEELSNFIFSMDGASANKRIRKIELLSPRGDSVKTFSFVLPRRRRFVIGLWPWQYKPIGELEKLKARGRLFLEGQDKEFWYLEDAIKFTQPIHNNEVKLRIILLKSSQDGPADIALLTNLDPEEDDTSQVLGLYLRRFASMEAERALIAGAIKKPSYYENFVSSEKVLRELRRLNDCGDWDNFFSILVEILNLLAQRAFLGSDGAGWGLLKTRELIYKKSGLIKRDISDNVLFNLFIDSMLDENKIFLNAATRFNDSIVREDSGRKILITFSSQVKNS